jgi:hypothetical protein
MDDHTKGFPKNFPHIPVPIIGKQNSCLTTSPNNFLKGFQISIMKSFAPSPSLRVGFDDIPPTHPLYVLRPILNKLLGSFYVKCSNTGPTTILVDFSYYLF